MRKEYCDPQELFDQLGRLNELGKSITARNQAEPIPFGDAEVSEYHAIVDSISSLSVEEALQLYQEIDREIERNNEARRAGKEAVLGRVRRDFLSGAYNQVLRGLSDSSDRDYSQIASIIENAVKEILE